MTEGDKNEVKFEIEKFKAQKRTKFVVQVRLFSLLLLRMFECLAFLLIKSNLSLGLSHSFMES